MKQRIKTLSAGLAIFIGISSCASTTDYSNIKQGYQHFDQGNYEKAQPYFEHQLASYAQWQQEPELYFKYAYTHFYLKNYDFSAHYFKRFEERFHASNLAEEAAYRSPDSYYQLNPNYQLSQEATYLAIDGFQHFLSNYPASTFEEASKKKLARLQEKLYQKASATALNYFHWKNYTAAKQCFQNLLLDAPDTENKDWILFMIFKSSYQLAKQYRFRVPKSELQVLLGQYHNLSKFAPNSPYTKASRQLLKRAKISFS